jgi:hypothetical protein
MERVETRIESYGAFGLAEMDGLEAVACDSPGRTEEWKTHPFIA